MTNLKFKAVYDGVLYDFVELTSYKDGSLGISIGTGYHDLFTPKHDDKLHIIQFVGVHDKNTKEIYSNHILDYMNCAKFIIEWSIDGGVYGFILKCIEGIWKGAYWDVAEIIGQENAFTIIGSIYDKKES